MKQILGALLLALIANASQLNLKPGQSKIFHTQKEITTAFASDPKIFDYKIINPTTIAVYSKADGYGEITLFSNSETIMQISAKVDEQSADLGKIAKIIEEQNAGAKVKIEKLSALSNTQKGYIISGTVPNEEIREKAYITAATALGLNLKRENIKKHMAIDSSKTGVEAQSKLSSESENLPFLTRVNADGLVDAMKVAAPKLVNVKLVVADVEKGFASKLGIDYNNGGIFRIPLLTTNPFNTHIADNMKLLDITSIVTAIKNDSIAKVLATPNLSVLSGESASFQVTSQFTPFSASVDRSGNAVYSSTSPIDYGVTLAIQPRVYSKDKITLNISQEVSNIMNIVEQNGASAANLKKRRTQSVIELADGDSFILSGLVDERDREEVQSVPVLGDIPLLGAAFRKSAITRSKTELIVIATVTLQKASKEPYYDVPSYHPTSILGSLFAIPTLPENVREFKVEFEVFTQNLGFIK